jgi:hypothetical protein
MVCALPAQWASHGLTLKPLLVGYLEDLEANFPD